MAYQLARSQVYSRYPDGMPPRERFTPRECELVDDDERERATLKRLRQERIAAHRQKHSAEDSLAVD